MLVVEFGRIDSTEFSRKDTYKEVITNCVADEARTLQYPLMVIKSFYSKKKVVASFSQLFLSFLFTCERGSDI